jgi:hypothetical protein
VRGGAPLLALAALLALGGSLLALGGCRSLGPIAPPLAAGDARSAALVDGLAVLGASRTSLRAGARVSISGQRRASFARQLMLLERPGRLRLEVMGVLGQRVAVLASDGARYELYRAERPGIESGEVHPWILFEVAGLALTPEEAVRLALGAPLAPGEGGALAAGGAVLADGSVRVELRTREGEARRSLEFGPAGELRSYAVHDPAGALVLEARYADYRDVGGTPFAHEIALELPAAESSAEIRFQWVELNPALGDELFHLAPRGGAGEGAWRPSAS